MPASALHDILFPSTRIRDEQRAWYDTLRDLVPSIKGLRPTVRLYARDRAWCSLDPDSKEDRSRHADEFAMKRIVAVKLRDRQIKHVLVKVPRAHCP